MTQPPQKKNAKLPVNTARERNGSINAAVAKQYALNVWNEEEKKKNRIILYASILCTVLASVVTIFDLNRPNPVRFIYADTNGNVRPLISENRPNMSDADAAAWLASSLKEIFTFNYDDYKDRITNARKFFASEPSFKEYYEQLEKSKMISLVVEDFDIMRATVTAAPFLDNSGIVDGRYTWHFVVPVQIDFISENHQHDRSMSLKFHVSVTRISESFSSSGLGISTFFSERD